MNKIPDVTGYHKYTPLRITAPFILGIICIINTGAWLPAGILALISVFFFTCYLSFYFLLGQSYRYRWIAGFLAGLTLFFSGMAFVGSIWLRNTPSNETRNVITASPMFICRIEISPVAKTGGLMAQAYAVGLIDSVNNVIQIDRKILVHFKSDTTCKSLRYGDLILVSGSLQAIPAPTNPYVFDYKKYLNNQQVYYQAFVDPGRWNYLGVTKRNPVKAGAEVCRNAFLDVFRKFGIEGQEFALAAALLLGSRDFLEKETEQEFSNAGAVHVLSVSGLHVGIMYVVVDKLLFFLKRGRISRKVHNVLIICCIWAYAFITGLPSSVVRAAMMFSLIAAGSMMKRNSGNYNILAVAAFFQLLINPFEITSVGFQLSYLAVLGIFIFYKPLNESIGSVNRPVEWLWSIIAVSLAAQLVTFPLGCYYFHMFPVYFLVTNLLVVPLAAVITYFAVFLLVAGATGLTSEWLAWPLQQSLRFMISSVEYIQSWPGAVIEPVVFSGHQVIFIFLFIAALYACLVMNYRRWALMLPVCVILFSLSVLQDSYKKAKASEIIVYNIPGSSAIDLISNEKALFICDKVLPENQKKVNFQIKPNRIKMGVDTVRSFLLDEKWSCSNPGSWLYDNFVIFNGMRIVFINSSWDMWTHDGQIETDLAVISGNPRSKIDELLIRIRMKKLVIDSSVPPYLAGPIKESCRQLGIPCHHVREEGAFVLKW